MDKCGTRRKGIFADEVSEVLKVFCKHTSKLCTLYDKDTSYHIAREYDNEYIQQTISSAEVDK